MPPAARHALRRGSAAALAGALALLSARAAQAAACCISATSFGVGRLLIWEDAAAGLSVGHSRSLGQYDAGGRLRWNPSGYREGLTNLTAWGIVRVHKRVQVQAWVPVVLNDRASGDERQFAGGLGDVGLGARFEYLGIGELRRVPSFAVTLSVAAPTGRRVEQTSPPLFAGATGRGAWTGSVAVEAEYAFAPWFLRLDAGLSMFLPFTRSDTGQSQLYGPMFRASLSAGREVVPDLVVVALALSEEVEAPLRLDGAVVEGSLAHTPSVAASVSWRADPHVTLVATLNNGIFPSGFAANRDARLGFTLGVRYGHF